MILSNTVKNFTLQNERGNYMVHILFVLVAYVGVTYWLNTIRTSASLWFVWVLIIIQLSLYCSIFITSYFRFKDFKFKRSWFLVFYVCFILGRIENWELFIIPIFVSCMLLLSAKNKNISDRMQKVYDQS
ncbi:MAG: hypothetical protein ACD_19C00020G0003 [uncultured bacterium]|nr:MAG: hypothetical protein ACD_19C00020G0003 [uncultured bacterium]